MSTDTDTDSPTVDDTVPAVVPDGAEQVVAVPETESGGVVSVADTAADPEPAAEPAPEPAQPPQPSARVEIHVGAHQVVVEATERLTAVADTALAMWKATDGPGSRRLECTMGFHFDVAEPDDVDEVTLPGPMLDTDEGKGKRRGGA